MSPPPIDPDTVSEVSQKIADSRISTSSASLSDPSKFQPIDRSNTKPDIELSSGETWLTVLETPCTFGANIFEEVMLNFIKNPNVTSSYLFRADILHDSESTQSGTGLDQNVSPDTEDHKPKTFELTGWKQDRVIVRLLIPRNQQLDRPLVQTCILLSKEKGTSEDLEEHLVVYIPHTSSPEETPFYHPRVARLAFHHSFRPTMNNDPTTNNINNTNDPTPGTGTLSISYNPFQSSPEIDSKLQRTGLKLLQTIHKHGQGQLGGYKKRVHHDRLIPQKSYQDTYARLKAKYGRKLSEGWVEVTDPSKHVFEDLGIAAFCLELWQQMYQVPETAKGEQKEQQAEAGAEDVAAGQSEGGEVKPENGTVNQKPPTSSSQKATQVSASTPASAKPGKPSRSKSANTCANHSSCRKSYDQTTSTTMKEPTLPLPTTPQAKTPPNPGTPASSPQAPLSSPTTPTNSRPGRLYSPT
jgi:hypothetical protein